MYITIWYDLQECGDFTWRVPDCEELVGVTHRREWGWFRRIQHISSIGGFFNNGGFESESRN